jgi:hypothetical protein
MPRDAAQNPREIIAARKIWASNLLLPTPMRALNSWKVPFVCAFATVGLPLALVFLTRTGNMSAANQQPPLAPPAPTAAASAPPRAKTSGGPVEISLNDALGRRWLQAQYQGNGRDVIKASLTNCYAAPLRVTVDAGSIFETADLHNQTVIARGETIELAPGARREAWLQAAATHSGNIRGERAYRLCPDTLPALAALFAQSEKCPEISRDAIQTAVLMITENAPLGVFARFTLLSGTASAKPFATTFQVGTGEILTAFSLLKQAGYPRGNFAATHDSQLRIESMIDPLSHAAALRYYRIPAEQEWAYWRDELQQGDLSTRHYALYGIGRYFPDVALQMLPDWARAKHMSSLYRTSAIQAMAETRRSEAISVLQSLVSEFGAATELGQSSRKAIAYLENQRNATPAPGMVEFRLSQANLR